MAGTEEFIGVLFSCLEEMSEPCTIDTLCEVHPRFRKKIDQIKPALQTMCDLAMVIRLNGDEYILKDKYDAMPDPQSISKCRSLDTDGGSHQDVPAMVPGSSRELRNAPPPSREPRNVLPQNREPRNTLPSREPRIPPPPSLEPRNVLPQNREPVTSPNQNTGMMKAGNNIDPLTESLNDLQIAHRNNLGPSAVPQQAIVESSSHSQLSVDARSAVEYTRQCDSIIQLLKHSDRPMLAKDIAQQTNIGKSRADVNRMLYFLQAKHVICLTDDKKPFWKWKEEASAVDLEAFGAELASKPDSKRSKNKQNPSTVKPSNDGECDCPNAARGCLHLHRHEHYHTTNIQSGSGNQMNIVNHPSALRPPGADRP